MPLNTPQDNQSKSKKRILVSVAGLATLGLFCLASIDTKAHRAVFHGEPLFEESLSLVNGSALQDVTLFNASSNPFDALLSPETIPEDWPGAEKHNQKTMLALLSCLSKNNCKSNQKKVVIGASYNFPALADTANPLHGGETIWLASLTDALDQLGYSVFYTCTTQYNMAETLKYYSLFRNLVTVVFIEASQLRQCMDDPFCIKSGQNPTGIPIWQMLVFNIWSQAASPLGRPWTLAIEDLPDNKGNLFLGYSLEKACAELSVVAQSQRRNKAFVLGKEAHYFMPSEDFSWNAQDFTDLRSQQKLDVVGGYFYESWLNKSLVQIPDAITNLGFMSKEAFRSEVATSKVMIGIGKPVISPSPYEGLCVGVPFICPVLWWNVDEPDNRAYWHTQHDGLLDADAPYVYFVKKGDSKGFAAAVTSAIANPIEPYIAPKMTQKAFLARIERTIDTDWLSLAKEVLPTLTDGVVSVPCLWKTFLIYAELGFIGRFGIYHSALHSLS